MSFGFSVGDFLAVIELVNKVRKGFVSAPDQFREISNELGRLENTTRDIEVLLSARDLSSAQEGRLHEITKECRLILKDAQGTVDKHSTLKSRGTSVREKATRLWNRLQWEPDDVHNLRDRITLSVTSCIFFVEMLNGENIAKLVKGQEQQEQREQKREDQEKKLERQKVLDWLTLLDYSTRQSDFIRRRQAGTGQWLLGSTEYQHWLTTKKEALFCPGIPGAGKTMLASIVVDDLLRRYRDNESIGICYVFFDFRQIAEQKLEDLVASLLKQLAQAKPALSNTIKFLYDKHNIRSTRPSVEELCDALHSVATEYDMVFIVIDALDEYQSRNDYHRSRFIDELLDLWSKFGVNILATSRFIPEITSRFKNGVKELEIRASNDDIAMYMDGKLSCLPRFVACDKDFWAEIKQSIVECVDGMFLLAQLHLESLRGKRSRKAVREILSKLSKGSSAYDTAYNDAMVRIKGQLQDQEDPALQTLSWIIFAKRPLTTTELRHALSVELNTTEFDEDNLPELEDMVSYCCGLVTIDEGSDIIRLVHYTTQEYFERTGTSWFPSAHSQIAEICVTYISYDAFGSGTCLDREGLHQRLSLYPLYHYACHNWGTHAYSAPRYEFCYKFLSMTSHFGSCNQILFNITPEWEAFSYGSFNRSYSRRVTAVHLAAHFGLTEAVRALSVYELDARDRFGKSPIFHAIIGGHTPTVELLLEKGIMVDAIVEHMTLLSHAAAVGQDAIVQLLLERNADIESMANDSTRTRDRTPISFAAENGFKTIVQLLLEKKANVNQKCERYGRTPITYATINRHEAIVQLLLEHGADPNLKDMDGCAPISYAAAGGHEAIVRLLVEKGADIDAKDDDGYLPITYAAGNGNETIVQLLLEKNAKFDVGYEGECRTPISHAARTGNEAMVLFFQEKHVNINSTFERDGRTPISYAADQGHEAIVRLLFERGADIELKDIEGQTPLTIAAQRSYRETIVQFLLDNGANVNSKDNYGRTPLSYASEEGHGAIVRLLLGKGADLESKDTNGWTPLFYALGKQGGEAMVQLLLGKGADVKWKDNDGLTPLSHAVSLGAEAIVQLLLEKGADIESKGESH